MSENYSILDLPKLIRIARENAILGHYDKALGKYKIALPVVKDRINEVSDNLLKEKWRDVEKYLKTEIQTICEIIKSCDIFKNVYTESGEQKRANVQNVNLDNPNDDPYSDKIRKDAELLRKIQGGPEPSEPYQPRNRQKNDVDDILKNIRDATNNVENNFNNLPKSPKKNNDDKSCGYAGLQNALDRIPNRQSNKVQPQPSNNNNQYQGGGGYGGGGHGGRINPMQQINNALGNYQPSKKMEDKYGHLAHLGPDGYIKGGQGGGNYAPKSGGGGKYNAGPSGKGGQAGKGGQPGKDGKGNQKKEEKSGYLLSVYPDGNGPDT